MTGRRRSVIPGRAPALGLTLAYLSLVVLIPLAALAAKAAAPGSAAAWGGLAAPRTLAAFAVTFGSALTAAAIDLLLGTALAWVLTRYRLPFRRAIDAAIDLPFALPTAVAGIALTALYARSGLIGGLLAPLGISVAYQRAGIVVALVFVGLPFVVRTVQPLLAELELEAEIEEAAATLGAGRLSTLARVVLPTLWPGLLAGFALALARGIGEYGSVIFIAGNRPGQTEIVPLLIVTKLDEYDYAGASVLAVAALGLSLSLLLLVNLAQLRASRRS